VLPSGDGPRLPAWAALSVCGLSLLSFSKGAGGAASGPADQESLTPAARPPAGSAGGTASEGASSPVASRGFKTQCAVHVAAGVYIAAALAPKAGGVTYGMHVASTFLSLAVYGWTLVAPYLFPNRAFG